MAWMIIWSAWSPRPPSRPSSIGPFATPSSSSTRCAIFASWRRRAPARATGKPSPRSNRCDAYTALAAPLLGPVQACRVIAHLVDGFLLVVPAHHPPRRLVEEAFNVVERGKMLGLVFNGDDQPPSSFYGHYGYYGGNPYAAKTSPNGHDRGRLGR